MSPFRDIFGAKGICLRRQTGGHRPSALISIGGAFEIVKYCY